MKPKTTTRTDLVCLVLGFVALLCVNTQTAQAQQIQVSAADPAAAAQATVNLDVRVTGKGFKNGANAKFLVTGTADPGGVQVNSTTFVSSTELRVNIDVAETATIAGFDIQVSNSDGRGGKGTELFRVVEKGTAGGSANCPPLVSAPITDTKCYDAISGCLDVTFGTNGIVITDPSVNLVGYNHPTGVLIQDDGKIIATGMTSGGINTDGDFVVLRYQTDGSLDTTFGDPDLFNPPLRLGYVRTPFTSSSDLSWTSVLQPDGKIVLAGQARNSNGVISWAVARYHGDGILDSSFGTGGKQILNASSSSSSVQDMAIQSDGKLVLVGEPAFTIMRLNQDGSPDPSFGTAGKVSANPSSSKRTPPSGLAYAVAIQRIPAVTGEERIVVGGKASDEFALMRFKPNGTLDSTFGSSGRAYASFFGFGDQSRVLAIDQANRIVAAGRTNTAISNCGLYVGDFAVARFTQNGSIDISFSGDGKVSTDLTGGSDSVDGLLIQTDGKIVVTGGNASSDFALVRYNDDGSPDSSFGPLGTGVVTTDTSPSDWSYAIAQQPWDGKIVVAGISSFSHRNMALARYWP